MATITIPGVGTIDLPDYAQQHTLESLHMIMAGMSAEQSQDFGTLANKFATNSAATQRAATGIEATHTPIQSIANSSIQNVKQTQLTLKQMKQGIKNANKNAQTQNRYMRQIPQVMRSAGSLLTGGGAGDLAALMPGKFGAGINFATKVLGKFADTQRSLTDVGMGLGASIIDTTVGLAKLNMPIFEFERVAGQYSLALDGLNDSTGVLQKEFAELEKVGVHKGAIMFAALSDQVRKGMEPFGNMGLTVTEINTFLGEYLESDRKRGVNTQTSFESLTANFADLIKETSAYAMDTGRNRKDMIKAQIETLSREDAAGYAMRMRMKGDNDAAKNFEDNLGVVSNEMFARFGKAGDAVKEMMLQAVMSGRGLEATEEGANLMAMYGEAGGVLNDMVRQFKTGKLDPDMFEKLSVALKNGTKAFDLNNYAVIKAQNAALGTVESMQIMEKSTTKQGRAAAIENKEGEARMAVGAQILKGNELLVKSTAAVQQASARVANAMVGTGPNGEAALAPALEKGIEAVTSFIHTMGTFAQGEFKKGAVELFDLIVSNPIAQIFGATAAVTGAAGIATGRAVLGGGMSSSQRMMMASQVAATNIANQTKSLPGTGPGGRTAAGLEYDGRRYIEGAKFKHEGVQYQVKNGQPIVTKAGQKTLSGIGKFGKGVRTGGAVGLMTAALTAYDTYQAFQATTKEYESLIAGSTGAEKEGYQKELLEKQQNIIGRGIAEGGGGILGGGMGATALSMFGPLGTVLGGLGGTFLGSVGGESLWKEYGDDIVRMMQESEELGAAAQEKMKKKKDAEEKESPIYIILQELKMLLSDWLGVSTHIEENTQVAAAAGVITAEQKTNLGVTFSSTS